jgi:hypothetical protein
MSCIMENTFILARGAAFVRAVSPGYLPKYDYKKAFCF